MKKKILIISILIVAIVQLAVPASMIAGRQRTLREGTAYKFRTAPVDPYDAFRGRYVAISVERATVNGDLSRRSRHSRDRAFATLVPDSNGYAVVSSVSREAPASGDFIRVKAWTMASNQVQVIFPIERFYLPEDEAPAAESAYRRASSRGQRNAEVVVRVRKGDLVIEDLLIEGTPIRQWLATHEEESN